MYTKFTRLGIPIYQQSKGGSTAKYYYCHIQLVDKTVCFSGIIIAENRFGSYFVYTIYIALIEIMASNFKS